MDVRDMTVREALDDPRIRALLDRYVPDYKKYPVALFGRMKLKTLVQTAAARGIVDPAEAERIFDKLNRKLSEEADT